MNRNVTWNIQCQRHFDSISKLICIYADEYPSESNQNAKVQGFASPRPPGMALSEFRNGQSTFSSSFKDDIAAFRR